MSIINLSVINYTKTVSVYIDDVLIDIKNLSFNNRATYNAEVFPGIHHIRVIKSSEITSKHWKRGIMFNWIALLLGVPDFTFKELLIDISYSSISFNVDIKYNSSEMTIELQLKQNELVLIDDKNRFSDIKKENTTDKKAQKRTLLFYFFPLIFLTFIIFTLMLAITVYFIIKSEYLLFFMSTVVTILLVLLFIKLIKMNLKK